MSTGKFEIHVTLSNISDTVLETLRKYTSDRRIKLSVIELPKGDTPVQVMATLWESGTYDDALQAEEILTNTLTRGGFTVSRSKVEATIDSEIDVPVLYYEHHVKLLLPAHVTQQQLEGFGYKFNAKASKNARRVREDGLQERFLTQRSYGSKKNAIIEFNLLLNALKDDWFIVLEDEQESIFTDTNIQMDKGWIPIES